MKENEKVVRSGFWANVFKPPTDISDLIEILSTIPLFTELSKRDLSALFNVIHNRSYLKGEFIFHQGDPSIGMYIIREGEVRIERKFEQQTFLLAKFRNGDFFGELALIDDEKRSASAIAESDCKLAVIFKPDLDDFISRYPKKGVKILHGISHVIAVRLRKVNEDNIVHQALNKKNSEN
ncbi:MAG: cyclic nucleotide-binding domain-containing protein [Ignavibacteriaceae bacterium]|nr:cyclic nucleotide-binding domain-containing protein [Ignavibacteriaceae bacterium]